MKYIRELETPCLILDKKLLSKNCQMFRNRCNDLNVSLRPHVKTPKSVEIAKIAHGNKIGPITVSTLNEAEYFAKAGFTDIIYAVCVVPNKLNRISYIQEKYKCNLKILLDSIEIANEIKNYSELNNKALEILIEIDSGEGRGGLILQNQKIYEIINAFLSSKSKIIGVLTHAGHSYKTDKKENIKKIATKEREIALSAAKFLQNNNNHCKIISVGSTPTIMEVDHLNGITEARSGVYMLWDLSQASKKICSIDDIAISVLASVINHNFEQNKIVIDAGSLALSKDTSANRFMPNAGYGIVCNFNTLLPYHNLCVNELYQEHGIININNKSLFNEFPIGSLIRILPNHSCITCAGFENYYVIENNEILDTWYRTNGW